MKLLKNTNRTTVLSLLAIFLLSALSWSQPKRIKPPKKDSRVKSVDLFVNNTFKLYHKVFVYDSLLQAGVDVPPEIEEELIERAEQDADSLWEAVPDIVDDVSNAPLMRKARAALNLNKAKKALKYAMKTAKAYFVPTDEEEDN